MSSDADAPTYPAYDGAQPLEVKDSDGRVLTVSAKAYEVLLKGRGYTLVDPASYPGPPPFVPLPSRADIVETISREDAGPLDPEQTAPAPRSGKK